MDPVARHFDAEAAGYEAQRRRLVPPYDAFYGAAVAALDLAGRPVRRVLDLGAGTGLLARMVREAVPGAELTLLDAAPGMLGEAERALGASAAYVVADLAEPLPAGPWDAVVSALAIHHLEDGAKRSLFARVFAELAPGGVFVNAEQVLGPTPWLEDVYLARHRAESRALGATAEEWDACEERMVHDRGATVEDQLAWLRAAGFPHADCLYKHDRYAVLFSSSRANLPGQASSWEGSRT